jgi:hypothetical protein
MADKPQRSDADLATVPLMPTWARSMRVTKEQLAAAERTRNYHVRKLQSQIAAGERVNEPGTRSEH